VRAKWSRSGGRAARVPGYGPETGGVAEPVYALDSKSSGLAPCGFESHRPHPTFPPSVNAVELPLPPHPADDPERDLASALAIVLERDGQLLTAGEVHVLESAQSLSPTSRALLARLLQRRVRAIRVGSLEYTVVPDPGAAARELVVAGLADDEAVLPLRLVLEAYPNAALVEVLARHGSTITGARAALRARVAAIPAACAELREPLVRLRHKALFARVARLFLYDDDDDLRRIVLARIGVFHYPAYQPTGGPGPFRDRRSLIAYETALGRLQSIDESTDPGALAASALDACEQCRGEVVHRRLSSRRLDEALAFHGARELERRGSVDRALALYEGLHALSPGPEVAHRMALCLEALGRETEGAAVCAAARDVSPADARLGLDRTGRRLARKAQQPWVPLPPIRAAAEREVLLDVAGAGTRPLYRAESESPAPIEKALVAKLRSLGRLAMHTESAPWTTLFGLLLREALFAPVAGMLPTAYLRAPLDLGTPGFAARRRAILDDILDDIAWGGAAARLELALDRPREAIVGVHPDLDGAFLRALVDAIPAAALSAILRHMAERYHEGRSGLPDLAILPGPEVRIAGAVPGRVDSGLVLAELKGPTDSLRDNQRVWIDRLLALGLRVELWTVAPVMRPAA
jgi:hypothetical protein